MVLAIAPLALYGCMVLVPLVLAVLLRFVIVVPMRECIQCERRIAVTTLTCRHCGHRYSAEDRMLLQMLAEQRKAEVDELERVSATPEPRPAEMSVASNGVVPRLECVACEGK